MRASARDTGRAGLYQPRRYGARGGGERPYPPRVTRSATAHSQPALRIVVQSSQRRLPPVLLLWTPRAEPPESALSRTTCVTRGSVVIPVSSTVMGTRRTAPPAADTCVAASSQRRGAYPQPLCCFSRRLGLSHMRRIRLAPCDGVGDYPRGWITTLAASRV
jgi:hypothetical protein